MSLFSFDTWQSETTALGFLMREISRLLLLLAVFETLLWFQPIVEANTDGLQDYLKQNNMVLQQAQTDQRDHQTLTTESSQQQQQQQQLSHHEAIEALKEIWRSAGGREDSEGGALTRTKLVHQNFGDSHSVRRSLLSTDVDDSSSEVRQLIIIFTRFLMPRLLRPTGANIIEKDITYHRKKKQRLINEGIECQLTSSVDRDTERCRLLFAASPGGNGPCAFHSRTGPLHDDV